MKDKKVKILYSHRGREGKDGWGRSFSLAKAMAEMGNEVIFLTNKNKFSVLPSVKVIKKVKVISFPDILPPKFLSAGFGFVSIAYKIIYCATKKFDLVISDLGHRPTGLPCKVNRIIFNSLYLVEWWDFLGPGGYYNKKPFLFKLLYGRFEIKGEIRDKLKANGVVVLSEFMKRKAESIGVKNVKIIFIEFPADHVAI